MKKRSRSFYVLIGIAVFVVIVLIWGVASYNGLVGMSTTVDQQQSNIGVTLQRRADLIPSLVACVKKYTEHEEASIKLVTDARAKLAGATTISQKAAADTELTGALNRLLVVAENYPNLKADSQFAGLEDNIAGTENRIAIARRDYNSAVTSYNAKIRTFPTVFVANLCGFRARDLFQASASASSAPDVASLLNS